LPPIYRVFSLKNNLTYGPIIGGQVTEEGYRVRTIFTLGVHLKLENFEISLQELKSMLEEGRKKSCTPEKEFERTLKSALKSQYTQRLSVAKMKQWGLLPEKISHPASEPRDI